MFFSANIQQSINFSKYFGKFIGLRHSPQSISHSKQVLRRAPIFSMIIQSHCLRQKGSVRAIELPNAAPRRWPSGTRNSRLRPKTTPPNGTSSPSSSPTAFATRHSSTPSPAPRSPTRGPSARRRNSFGSSGNNPRRHYRPFPSRPARPDRASSSFRAPLCHPKRSEGSMFPKRNPPRRNTTAIPWISPFHPCSKFLRIFNTCSHREQYLRKAIKLSNTPTTTYYEPKTRCRFPGFSLTRTRILSRVVLRFHSNSNSFSTMYFISAAEVYDAYA